MTFGTWRRVLEGDRDRVKQVSEDPGFQGQRETYSNATTARHEHKHTHTHKTRTTEEKRLPRRKQNNPNQINTSMSHSKSVSEWDIEYAKVARMASSAPSPSADELRQVISSLETSLDGLPLSAPETNRRKQLLHHLKSSNYNSSNDGGDGGYQPPTTSSSSSSTAGQQQQTLMQRAIAQQDSMLEELSVGMGRLRNQSEAIGDEARLHVGLLNDMDSNLDAAHAGLEAEARRAARLREDKSLWHLQLVVAGLTILFFLLLLLGM